MCYNNLMFDNLVVSFLADEVVGGFFVSVPPGYIACIYDRGRGVLKNVYGPGLHLKIPFWQIAKLFNAQILEYTIQKDFDPSANKEALGDRPVPAVTKDDKEVLIEGSILFRIDKSNAPELWENIGENFVSKVVRPFSRSKIASVLAHVTLDELTSHRPEIEKRLQQELNQEFRHRGLICEGVLLSSISTVKDSLAQPNQTTTAASDQSHS